MISTIKVKITILFLLAVSGLKAQDSLSQNTEIVQYGSLSISAIYAIPTGDSFVNKAYQMKPGFAVDLYFILSASNILLGFSLNTFDADVQNLESAGNYTDSNITYFGVKLGYQYSISKKIKLLGFAGIGPRTYYNSEPVDSDFEFRDNGTSMPLDIRFVYQFSQNFGCFTSVGYQVDWLNIDTPPEISDDFDTITYFNLQLGMRILFWET